MAGFQMHIVMGNVTRDPEVHKTGGGKTLAKFSVAVNGYNDTTEYFDIVWWDPKGGLDYVVKGTQVLVTGEMEKQTWEKDGEKHSRWVINTRNVKLCGGGKPGGAREPAAKGEGKRWDDFG